MMTPRSHIATPSYHPALRGLGSDASIASSAIGTAGALTAAFAPALALAGPIGAVAGALIGIFSQIFKGCGQTCVIATQDVNQVAVALQQNLTAYQNSGHTQSEQAAALQNFDAAWAALTSANACGNPSLGPAGQRCISERQRGGVSNWCCKAPTCSSQPSYVGCSTPSSQSCNGGPPCCSGCDFFVTFRDPIANDPNVVPDSASSVLSGLTGGGSSSLAPLALLGGLGLLLLVLL